ncbi:hypothetical protein [Conexibacter woesei]|uniref:hypothetical protein n=1 Tax=Conexibacter woesei TaxID=191495 RepID=UPI0011D1EC27|nr:hypothetical protein [Conexibacter woesei]
MQQALEVRRSNAVAARPPQPAERRSPLDMAGEALDLVVGAVAVGMPFLLLSMPAIVLFVLFPLMLAAIPAAIAALLLAPPVLVVRAVRRRGRTR